MRFSWFGISLIAVVLACSQWDTFAARLPDVQGLAPGAPVIMAGIHISTVQDVRIDGAEAAVTFSVRRRDHKVKLHEDACAAVLPVDKEPTLFIFGGQDGELAPGEKIPACEITPDDMRALGEYLGEMAGAFGEGLFSGCAGRQVTSPRPPPIMLRPVQPPPVHPPVTPSTPTAASPAPKIRRSTICDAIRVEVQSVDSLSRLLTMGGPPAHRVWLVIHNDNDIAVELPSVTDATFGAADRNIYSVDIFPDINFDDWFMPMTIPARSRLETSVKLKSRGAPVIGFIEIQEVSPKNRPFKTCTITMAAPI
ncbi:MAG: MCE family protein [Proteobacteria bacterium]|nr:MCE family protein [Pseudomonadota bacterium]